MIAVLHLEVLVIECPLKTLKGPLHGIKLILPELAQPGVGHKLGIDQLEQLSEGSYEPSRDKVL